MKRKWRIGDDLLKSDSMLDGFSFDDVICALRMERKINEVTARRVLREILEVRLQDMNFMFENNLDIIITEAMKGRE